MRPVPSLGSLAKLAGLAGYLGQVKPIATQIEATVAALPNAVKQLGQQLLGAITSVIASPNSTDTVRQPGLQTARWYETR